MALPDYRTMDPALKKRLVEALGDPNMMLKMSEMTRVFQSSLRAVNTSIIRAKCAELATEISIEVIGFSTASLQPTEIICDKPCATFQVRSAIKQD